METENKKIDAGLEFIWAQHRIYGVTANSEKAIISRWRLLVFIFTVMAAFLAVLAQNISIPENVWLPKIVGALSALFAGLAAYAGSEILTDDREKNWIRSRSASEAFKSQAYLYLLKAGPYSGDNAKSVVFQKVEELLKTTSEIKTIPLDQEQMKAKIPATEFSLENYLNERIKDQIYNYYFVKARKYDRISRTVKGLTLVLGFVSVILGTLGSLGYTEQLSVWIAFISTFTGSAAAFVAAGHYNQIVLSYQSTGNKLMMLVARWGLQEDDDSKKDLVVTAETILNMENGGWMTEMSEKYIPKSDAPAQQEPADETDVEPVEEGAEDEKK